MIKQILCFALVLSLTFLGFSYKTEAYSAASYCLYDPLLKKVIASKDKDRRLSMASTTKIMTALITCEICDLSDIVEVTDKMIAVEGSSIGLQVGDKISYKDLLYGLMLESGNDAALCIAVSISGSQEDFSILMNQKAKLIGMKNSNFVTPNGLDDENHYSTAYDMALLSSYAMNNKIFSNIVSTKTYKAIYNFGEKERTYYNHNRLLSFLNGADGIKTGFTKKSGRCLVSSCKRKGVRLIAVTLNDGNDWQDHKNLYEYGFKQYQPVVLPKIVKYISVTGSSNKEIRAESKQKNIYFYDGLYSNIKTKVHLPRFLYSPIKKGEKIGFVEYYFENSVIETADILACEDANVIKTENKEFILNEIIKIFTMILCVK